MSHLTTMNAREERQIAGAALRTLSAHLPAEGDAPLSAHLGESVARLPASAVEPLLEILRILAAGTTPVITGRDEELTTQEAADLLSISRPTLLQRLREGEIPFRWEGSHRRIRLADVLAYKQKRSALREQAFQDLRELEEELGLPEV